MSIFLMWDSAYSDVLVTETLWPDFRRPDYLKALMEYQKRDRRFGGLTAK
jgi:undecaprenyl diphosphate synthase